MADTDTTNDYGVRVDDEDGEVKSDVLGTGFSFPKDKALRFAAYIVAHADDDDEFDGVLADVRSAIADEQKTAEEAAAAEANE